MWNRHWVLMGVTGKKKLPDSHMLHVWQTAASAGKTQANITTVRNKKKSKD